jgi:4-amino-4-deoxy-L-arabinose transferase-like glycosyltransferase
MSGLLAVIAVALLLSAAAMPLERSQEARVLETAREMVVGPPRQWLIPRLNDHVRVQKPPLAYWMSAGAFKLSGVGRFTGRLPFVATTLALLALVGWAGRRWFSPGAGLAAVALTASCLALVRYGALAETDVVTALFITAACVALTELVDAPTLRRRIGLSMAAGLGIGLAAMSKGPPAIFPLAYLAVLALYERRWRPITDFLLLGGLPVAVLVGAPWWYVVAADPQLKTIMDKELTDVSEGTDHGRPFWDAFAMAILAILPWLLPAAAAVGWLVGRRGPVAPSTQPPLPWWPMMRQRLAAERATTRCLLWGGVILLILTITPQKQDHYFVPLVAPAMLLVGSFLARALAEPHSSAGRLACASLALTAIAALAAPALVLGLAWRSARGVALADLLLALVLLAAFTLILVLQRRQPLRAAAATLVAGCLMMPVLLNVWARSLRPATFAEIAVTIRMAYPNRPLLLYPVENYRLNFELQRVIPVCHTPADLARKLASYPEALVIYERPDPGAEPPDLLRAVQQFPWRGRTIDLCERAW